jgi:hypothetical protein
MAQRHSHYERSWAASFGVDAEILFRGVQELRCAVCGSVVNSPYIPPHVEDGLYRDVTPKHRAGWNNWNSMVTGGRPSSGMRPEIATYLTTAFPSARSYAEVGCPFQGLLGFLAPVADRRAAMVRATEGTHRRWMTALWRLERAARGGVNRLRDRRDPALRTSVEERTSWAPERFMISDPSGNRWQSGCIESGASCLQVAGSLSGVQSLTLDSLPWLVRSKGIIEIVGVFETLDHVRRPADLLRRIHYAARRILIVQHRAEHANRQHGFGFTEGLLDFLRDDLAPDSIMDLSKDFGGGTSFVWLLDFETNRQPDSNWREAS